MGDVSTKQGERIDTRTHACMCIRKGIYVSDICALTFKGAALTEEGAECDYRSGKRKNVRGRREEGTAESESF